MWVPFSWKGGSLPAFCVTTWHCHGICDAGRVSWAVLLCLRKLALVFTTLAPGDNENKQQLGWDAQAPRTDLAQLRVPAFLPRGSAVQAAGIHPAAKTPTGSRRITPSQSLKSGNSAAWLSCVQRLLNPLLVHAVQLWFMEPRSSFYTCLWTSPNYSWEKTG